MIRLNVQSNIRELTRHLDSVAKQQIPFATALAVTRTARKVKEPLSDEVGKAFDRPTPFVARSPFSTSATKAKPEATVGIRDQAPEGRASPAKYVQEHFGGGARGSKPMELALRAIGALPEGWRAVPAAGMKLDRYGNPDRRLVAEVLGALKARAGVFSGRGKRQALVGYFIVRPGAGGRGRHLSPGVWRRIVRPGMWNVIPVFVFIRSAQYRARIDLPKLAGRVLRQEFAAEFAAALDQASRSAR